MTLPKPTLKNSIILTIYAGAISLFSYFTTNIGERASDFENTINNLESSAENPNIALYLVSALFFIIIISGLVIITLYLVNTRPQSKLVPPPQKFSFFYFIFIQWIALYTTTKLVIALIALILQINVSTLPAVIISLILTTVINAAAIWLMRAYLGDGETPGAWLKKIINFDRERARSLIKIGLIAYLGFLPIILIGSLANQYILDKLGGDFPVQKIIEFSLENDSLIVSGLLLFMIVIIAPFFEELIMRGLVFRGLLKIGSPVFAMIISGFIFAAFHFNIFSLIPIAVVGALLAWLYHRTGSLLPGMIVHALFNGFNFLLLEVVK